MRRIGGYAGLLVILLSTSILMISLVSNPWFSVQKNAVSDLGRSSAQFNSVYNIGLLVSGFFFVFFLSQAYKERETSLGRLSLVFFGFTGIILVLIGLTSNRVVLSDYIALIFTLIGGSSVLLISVTLIWKGVPYARFFLAFITIGTILSAMAIIMFEGLAIAEFIAIVGYNLTIGVLSFELLL